MLAVAGLWIEQRTRLRAAGYSFPQLYQQALSRFAILFNRSSCEESSSAMKQISALDALQRQTFRASGTYNRRELRIRW